MMNEQNHDHAFPIFDQFHGEAHRGMTVRDWLAGQALGACVARALEMAKSGEHIRNSMSTAAYWAAVAAEEMLKELAKAEA